MYVRRYAAKVIKCYMPNIQVKQTSSAVSELCMMQIHYLWMCILNFIRVKPLFKPQQQFQQSWPKIIFVQSKNDILPPGSQARPKILIFKVEMMMRSPLRSTLNNLFTYHPSPPPAPIKYATVRWLLTGRDLITFNIIEFTKSLSRIRLFLSTVQPIQY